MSTDRDNDVVKYLSRQLYHACELLKRARRLIDDRSPLAGDIESFLANAPTSPPETAAPACAEVVHRDNKPCSRPDCPLSIRTRDLAEDCARLALNSFGPARVDDADWQKAVDAIAAHLEACHPAHPVDRKP